MCTSFESFYWFHYIPDAMQNNECNSRNRNNNFKVLKSIGYVMRKQWTKILATERSEIGKKGTQTCSCNSSSSSSYGRNICHLYLSIRTSDTFVLAVGSLIKRNVHSNSLLRVSMHIAQYKIAELCSPSGYFIQIECHTKIRRRKRRYGSNLNC